MNKITDRPFALTCGIYSVTLFLLLNFKISAAARGICLIAAVVISVAAIVILLKKKAGIRKTRDCILFLSAFLFALIIAQFIFYNPLSTSFEYKNSEHIYTIKIEGVYYVSSYSGEYKASVSEIDGERANYKILYSAGENGLEPGDVVKVRGELSEITDSGYYRQDGVFLKLDCDKIGEFQGTESAGLSSFFRGLNQKLCGIISKYAGGDGGSYAAAMTLGDRSALSDCIKRDFRELGIYHLLALSGLHVTLLCGIINFILKKPLGKKGVYIFEIGFIIFYIFLCGAGASVVRAGVMLIIYLFSFFIRRSGDGITTLLSTLAFICLIDPFSICDIGLMLSFSATLGILLYTEMQMMNRKKAGRGRIRKFLSPVTSALLVSLFAVIFTFPVTAVYYGEFPPLSALFTLILSPFVTVIIVLTLILLVFSFISPLAAVIGAALELIGKTLTFITSKIARAGDLTVSLKYPFVKYIIIAVAVAIVVIIIGNKKVMPRILAAVAAGIAVFTVSFFIYWKSVPETRYDLFTSGENDSVIAVSRGEATIIDSSSGSYSFFNKAATEIEDKYYLDEISEIIITHYHKGLPDTLDRISDKKYVYNIFLPKPQSDFETELYNSVIEKMSGKYTAVYLYSPEDKVGIRGFKYSLHGYGGIKRSTHSIYAFVLESAEERGVYLSSSYPEYDPELEIFTGEEKYIWIGTHGPGYKTAIEGNLPEGANIILSADSDREFYGMQTD